MASAASSIGPDFSIEIDAGHVVVKQVDAEDSFKILAAKFFTCSRIEISDSITSEKVYDDPDGTTTKYKIVFYSSLSGCKIKLRSLTDGPLVMARPTKSVGLSKSRELRNIEGARNIAANSVQTNLDLTEITSGFNTIKRLIELSNNRMEKLLKDMCQRLDNLEEKSLGNHVMAMKDNNLSITDMAMQAMNNCRSNPKWRKKIKEMNLESLTNEQTDQVKRVLLSGNKFPSKMAISLAKIIFGDLLKTHLLGEKGKPRRGARDGERTQTIPISLEDSLRDILLNFDDELFTEQPGWDLLIRGPINQSGREIKRKRNKKQLSETESESDNSPVSKRQKVANSQADLLGDEDENVLPESENQSDGHTMIA